MRSKAVSFMQTQAALRLLRFSLPHYSLAWRHRILPVLHGELRLQNLPLLQLGLARLTFA